MIEPPANNVIYVQVRSESTVLNTSVESGSVTSGKSSLSPNNRHHHSSNNARSPQASAAHPSSLDDETGGLLASGHESASLASSETLPQDERDPIYVEHPVPAVFRQLIPSVNQNPGYQLTLRCASRHQDKPRQKRPRPRPRTLPMTASTASVASSCAFRLGPPSIASSPSMEFHQDSSASLSAEQPRPPPLNRAGSAVSTNSGTSATGNQSLNSKGLPALQTMSQQQASQRFVFNRGPRVSARWGSGIAMAYTATEASMSQAGRRWAAGSWRAASR